MENNDRFEGLSAEFKRVMRYRAKTVDDVR